MLKILKYHKLIWICFLFLLGISIYGLQFISVNFELKEYRTDDDKEQLLIEELYRDFHINENMLLLALPSKGSVFSGRYLEKVHALSSSIDSLQGVDECISLVTLKRPVYTAAGLVRVPFLHISDQDLLIKDSIYISNYPPVKNVYISRDFDALALHIALSKKQSRSDMKRTLATIKELLPRYGFGEYHLAGHTYTELAYSDLLSREMKLMVLLTAMVLIALGLVLYRSLLILAALFIIVTGGIIVLYGYLGIIRQEISMINLLMPTLILIVGMSDFIHLYSGFLDNVRKGFSIKIAMKNTISEIGLATLLTSVTTAFGFIAMTSIAIKPIRTFGLDAAIGVMVTFIIAIFILPSILILLKEKMGKRLISRQTLNFTPLIDLFHLWIYKYRSSILIVTVMLLILSLLGLSRLDTNSFLLSKLKGSSDIKQDFYYFENHFSGIRDLEMIIEPSEAYVYHDAEVFAELEKIHDHLQNYGFVRKVMSPITLYKSYNMIYHGEGLKYYVLPDTSGTTEMLFREIGRYNRPIEKQYHNIQNDKIRLSVFYKDIGLRENEKFINELKQWIDTNLKDGIFKIRFTGYSILYDRANSTIIENMALSLLIAIMFISTLVAIIFKKLSMVIIALVPNILPLMILGGLLTVFGLELHGSLAMIFTIGFVIIVDDTIHFLARYRILLGRGLHQKEALLTTMHETGKAIIATSIMIFFGFLILVFSQFYEIAYFGILLCIASIIALFADLLLLPVLIRMFWK